MQRQTHSYQRKIVRAAEAVSLVVLLAIGPAAIADDSQPTSLAAAIEQLKAASSETQMRGHPTLANILEMSGLSNDMAGSTALAISQGVIFPEPQPPLATGTFVNFESPQVKPLALSNNGSILLATNTPNNSLLVIDTGISSGLPMHRVNEIPVGLDPVSVAIQPGTGDNLAWVANFISDNVSVVDLSLGTVVSVVEVGDEPVNILFNATGTFAFVVIQGSPADVGTGPIVQEGQLIAIDTATRRVVSHVFLDCNTPRAAVYNPATDQVIVAALHSGNNTTVVGELTTQPLELAVAAFFSQTSAIFAASPELGPVWPDVSTNPSVPVSPPVERIVFDPSYVDPNPAISNGWKDIIDVLSIVDPMGNLVPDPAMVTLLAQEANLTQSQAFLLIQSMIDDAKDTVDHDLIVVDVSNPVGAGLTILNKLGGVGTTLTGMGINANGEIFVSNLEPRNTVRTEPTLRGHFIDHQIVIVVNPQSPGALIVPTDLHDGIPGFNDVDGPNIVEARNKSLANPVDIVFDGNTDPGQVTAYVASLGVGRVAALHGTTASVLSRANVGAGPRGLALDGTNNLLYVMNRTDMSISRLDVSDRNNIQTQTTLPVFNPEPKAIKNARGFLYSTKLSNNFASSCALCHIDGRLDHLAWDLGDPIGGCQPPPPFFNPPPDPLPPFLQSFICITPQDPPQLRNHPVKGPMVTLSLQGLDDHEPLHWRGDHPLFQDFNSAFAGLLGGSQIPSADMDAFATFTKTINYGPNPFRNRDDSFKDPAAGGGLQTFLNRCNGCHQVSHGGALFGPNGDVGFWEFAGLFPRLQLQLVTQLRGIHKKLNSDLYNGFGLIHDGREERESNLPPVICQNPDGTSFVIPPCTDNPLCTFFHTFFQGFFCTPGEVEGVIAYCNAFPTNVKPVVGWQVKPSAPTTPQDRLEINIMIAQHGLNPSQNDVVATGLVNGQQRGFVLLGTDPGIIFESDLGTALTLNDLFNLINTGAAELVFTAVPPGSGFRIGVDQDSDGLLNGLDPMPQLNNDADVNLDGVVDGRDVQPFLTVIFNPAAVPDGMFQAADANNDGVVNLLDVDSVVSIMLNGSPV